MDWNLPVPKILHLYWGKNKKLSYMKYLTVVSFSKLNPEWNISIYYPRNICKIDGWDGFEQKSYCYQGDDYFNKLSEIKNVKLIEIKFNKEIDCLSEVHKSDLLRLELLASIGGVWSDFDIFYLQPITKLFFNQQKQTKDTLICYNVVQHYHSIGFLMSGGNNKFYAKLKDLALYNIKDINSLQYQNIGRDLYNYFFRYDAKKTLDFSIKYNVKIGNIPFNTIYPFQWNQINLIFGNQELSLPEDTIGIHWFAGSNKTSKYENIINEENIKWNKDKFLLKLMNDFI